MRQRYFSTFLGAFGLMVVMMGLAPSAEPPAGKNALDIYPKGWVDLLPGKDFKGWKRVPIAPDEKLNAKNPWSLDANGKVLICDGVGVKEMLLHEQERGDGIFHVEWRFRKTADKFGYNSGIYVRSASDGKIWIQAQVAQLEKPPFVADLFADLPVDGKIQRVQIPGKGQEKVHPPGEWNTYEITCKGKTISVRLNGEVVTTWKECPRPKGLLGLQAEFWFIEFKNLKWKGE